MRPISILVFLLFIFLKHQLFSQISIPGIPFDGIIKQSDSTTLTFYESIKNDPNNSFVILSPTIKFNYNSKYPRGYNDGAVWKGDGVTLEAHTGFQSNKGKFSLTFLPVFFYSQNSNFLKGESMPDFKYPFSNNVDWVQQYGFGSFTKFHFGQSEVRFQTGKFITSISTQNYSLGPSNYNPIILSRQAGGFPHLRLGLLPTNIIVKGNDLGKVEANLIMGIFSESDHYDDIEANDDRYINILALGYSPSFFSNLKLGFNKSLYKQTRFFEATDLLSTLFIIDNGVIKGDTLSPNDAFDQIASITMDWNFKEVGFRAYMEFAKNDFTSDGAGIRPTAVEPEHTRAYTIGFEKELNTKKGRLVRIGYEHTNLSRNSAFLWRPTPSYYTHGVNENGYSNDGQIIGAGIGPGGNSDHIALSINYASIKTGFLLQRIEHNRDYFTSMIRNANLHDIEYSLGGWISKEMENIIFFGEFTASKNYNRYYISDQNNYNCGLGVQFKIN